MNIKSRLIMLIKQNKFLFNIYYYVFSSILRFLGKIFKSNKNEILFVCYGGRKYGDSVRQIYLEMLLDPRFDNWKFIWAFRFPKTFTLPDSTRTNVIKIDSLVYFYHALKAKCWITNVSIQRGLDFKNKNTLYVNTWHGVPIKYIRNYVQNGFNVKKDEEIDILLAMGNYDAKIYPKAFNVDEKVVKCTGLPRNDVMFQRQNELKEKIRSYYNIKEKKIVLYAPTYREYEINSNGGYSFSNHLNIEKFNKTLGEKYVLFIRAHGAIEEHFNNFQGCIDVSKYPDVEDLLVASDILITDYSAILFDYSLLHKPILLYTYDLDEYTRKHGLFVDIKTFSPFNLFYNEDDIYNYINTMDYHTECEKTSEFCTNNGLLGDGATKRVVNEINTALSNKVDL